MKKYSKKFAPANIALIKYWGKRDKKLNLPTHSSLSLSLANLGTITEIELSDKDQLFLNNQELSPDNKFYLRAFKFINLIRQGEEKLLVKTTNNIPTGAGLASSASGFAALVLALDDFYELNLSKKELSIWARQGSGSAARSFWSGFVEWQCGVLADGTDSYAQPILSDWQDIRIGILEITKAEKKISSTEAMEHSRQSSPFFEAWVKQSKLDLEEIKAAIREKNFPKVGEIAENNALLMHSVIFSSRPAINYFLPQTLEMLHRVWDLRKNQGLNFFATIDAGANLKILYHKDEEKEFITNFPNAICINPFNLMEL